MSAPCFGNGVRPTRARAAALLLRWALASADRIATRILALWLALVARDGDAGGDAPDHRELRGEKLKNAYLLEDEHMNHRVRRWQESTDCI